MAKQCNPRNPSDLFVKYRIYDKYGKDYGGGWIWKSQIKELKQVSPDGAIIKIVSADKTDLEEHKRWSGNKSRLRKKANPSGKKQRARGTRKFESGETVYNAFGEPVGTYPVAGDDWAMYFDTAAKRRKMIAAGNKYKGKEYHSGLLAEAKLARTRNPVGDLADKISRWVMLNQHTSMPYQAAAKFGISQEQAEQIYWQAVYAFGVGGKGIDWFHKKVHTILGKRGKLPNPAAGIAAVEVLDLNNGKLVIHRFATSSAKGKALFEELLARYGSRPGYVVQGLAKDGNIIIDNQGMGGRLRGFKQRKR